jgi:predicted DNA-binding transcriptional regulator AlpA
MEAFRQWCQKQLDSLNALLETWDYEWEPMDIPPWIVQQAADRAARLGLADLYRKSLDIPRASLAEAKWFLAECLRSIPVTNETPASEARLLTVKDVSYILGVSTRTVWRRVSAGEMPKPIQVGGGSRWRRVDIERWLNG